MVRLEGFFFFVVFGILAFLFGKRIGKLETGSKKPDLFFYEYREFRLRIKSSPLDRYERETIQEQFESHVDDCYKYGKGWSVSVSVHLDRFQNYCAYAQARQDDICVFANLNSEESRRSEKWMIITNAIADIFRLIESEENCQDGPYEDGSPVESEDQASRRMIEDLFGGH